jgi:hypothetical protein
MKFNLGDRVTIRIEDHSAVTDFQADLYAAFADHEITEKTYYELEDAIPSKRVFTIFEVERLSGRNSDANYGLKIGRSVTPFLLNAEQLQKVNEK